MPKTSIEWTEHVWNPIRGCSRISEGCRNCYAERMAARFSANGETDQSGEVILSAGPFSGFAQMTPSGPRWTGKVELVPDALVIPLKRKKPTTYFVNSMSDLFHESLPDSDILSVFQAMGKCPQHRFIILTKRARRMAEFLSARRWRNLGHVGADFYVALIPGEHRSDDPKFLPNVILGVSCEDQAAADERIPHLLATPAACRMVSLEPLLGPIDLLRHLERYATPGLCRDIDGGWWHQPGSCSGCKAGLDWVIVGGESGPGARPMHPNWTRSLRDQCTVASVPFFFKQYGEWAPIEAGRDSVFMDGAVRDGSLGPERLKWLYPDGSVATLGHGHHIPEPEVMVARVGKKAAGRLLDGRVWDERPEVLR